MIKNNTKKDMLKLFDEHADMFCMLGSMTKDFTPLIETFDLFIEQLKITREISQEVKKELVNCTEEEFTKESIRRLLPRIEPIQKKLQKMQDSELNLMIFALPDKKGRQFFELTLEIEEISKQPMNDTTKRERIDNVITSLERYINEIKEISRPFVPAKIDVNQTIVFKVMFKLRKGIWRKIELKSINTLKNLHDAIQDAFEWDNDHLYSFFMDNKFNKGDFDMEYTSPYEPEGRKTADKAKVGIFDLEKGQKFAYLFDFGDDHRFEVEVTGFGTVDKSKDYPIFLESKGKAPEQYPDYDEE